MKRRLRCIWANGFLVIITVVITNTYYEQNTVLSILSLSISTFLHCLNPPNSLMRQACLMFVSLKKIIYKRIEKYSQVSTYKLRKSDSRYHLLITYGSNDLNGPYQGLKGAWGLGLFLQKKMLGSVPLFFPFKVPEQYLLWEIVSLSLNIAIPWERVRLFWLQHQA